MNVQRAQQIVQSKEKIDVEYQGRPVWIDGIDERSQMARVHVEQNPQESMTVAVDQLVEK